MNTKHKGIHCAYQPERWKGANGLRITGIMVALQSLYHKAD